MGNTLHARLETKLDGKRWRRDARAARAVGRVACGRPAGRASPTP
ncbi:MAG TPA: hypothetical protein VGB57_13440 [Allosphingosinicella sp.]